MAAEQYFLKWNNHQTTLLSVFNSLLDSENLADCILCAEGESLKAHQVVLSACSPYLEKLLNENRANQFTGHPILIFNDLKFEELKAMREYMYKGEVNVTQENLNSFLKAAQSLQVKGLADQGGGDPDDGGGGGGGGGGSKRKTESSEYGGRKRVQRRNSREENCDSESSSCDTSNVAKQPRQRASQLKYEDKYEPQVKMEPPDSGPPPPQPMAQLKTEPEQHDVEPVQDLTLDDDDYEDYDVGMPGTSQPDLTQEMTNWQMDGSMNSEDFAAAQAAAALGNQNQTNTQGPHVCDSCGRWYKYKNNLATHKRLECGKEPRMSCPHCSYRCKQPSCMKTHINLRHNPQAVYYSCTHCPYRSKSKGNLKVHQSVKHSFLLKSV